MMLDSVDLARDWACRFKPGTVYVEYFHRTHGDDAPEALLVLGQVAARPSIAHDWEILTGGVFVCPTCQAVVPRPLMVAAVGPFWVYGSAPIDPSVTDPPPIEPPSFELREGDRITIGLPGGASVAASVREAKQIDSDGRAFVLTLGIEAGA